MKGRVVNAERWYKWFSFQVINGIMRLSHLFACINSSANFLIYYVKGTKFRRAWVQTYSPIYEAIFPMCMVSNNNSEVEAPETNEGEKAFTKKSTNAILH